MNRRDLFKGASALSFTGWAGEAFAKPPHTDSLSDPAFVPLPPPPRETLLLNKGWRFFDGDIPMPLIVQQNATYDSVKAGNAQGAANPGFDDSEWAEVTLPHDFVSFRPIDPTANAAQGYRKRGIVWYRNSLKFDKPDDGKHIELQLDGVATYATVWFNGNLVDRNWSGYSSAYVDLTPYATYGESYNSLVVRVDASAMEGWWYEGGGIYRDVWIVKRRPQHIITDGVFAHPVKDGTGWHIPVEVTVNNIANESQSVEVTCDLLDSDGSVICSGKKTVDAAALEKTVLNFDISVPVQPRLWSPDTPNLYRVHTKLYASAQPSDEVMTTCGFRTERFDADKGFFLNDMPLKIKGICMHQDHAGVGTAVPAGIIDYRMRRLKETGCNAIRFSHNAQNKVLMDACDHYGFLVMAENRIFDPSPDYLLQLQWLIRRDRNHPCVYLWSVFNEEPVQGTESGYEMVRRMSHAVKQLDATRPVTAAMNDGLFAALSVAHAVDVVGINYQQDQYDAFHAAHPDKPMMSSEDTSSFMTRGMYVTDNDKHIKACYDEEAAPWGEKHRDAWKAVDSREFVAGTFVWTAFDYHGESTPFTYPSNSSYFGMMDLCGFEKAAFYIHKAQWVRDRPVLGLVPHWNWETQGQLVKVMAMSNSEEVELFVNGKSAGRQPVDKYEMNTWNVPYAPGSIEVRSFSGGKLVMTIRNETTGPAVALRMTVDRSGLVADGRDATVIKVEAVDAKGRTMPTANNMVTYAITGGTIIGLGNGDPTCLEPEKGYQRSLFNGLGQVIVQTLEGQAGPMKIDAVATGLKAVNVSLPVNSVSPIPAQATAPSVMGLGSFFRSTPSTTPPDKNADIDFATWQWFRPGMVMPPLVTDGYVVVAAHYTPYARIQKAGGTIEFFGIIGVCDVYDNGVLIGSKTDPATAPFSARLAAGPGERRLAVAFHPKAGEVWGFSDGIRVKM